MIQPTVTLTSTSSSTTTTTSEVRTTTTHTTAFSSSRSITSTSPSSTSTTTASFVCSSGFRSCPASLGGGCCATDRLCASQSCPASSTSTSISVGAPVRPTSATVVTTSESSTITATACPAGFYQCSAYYNGGACCQVGRDCALTSCPPHETSSVLVSDGVTILVAPTGPAANDGVGEQGSCANGWYSCDSDVGGGCCPSGFACGTASCTVLGSATATATASPVAKQNGAIPSRARGSILALALGVSIFWL